MSHHASMTDEELATAVRESVTSVHMTTPAEEITTRGRTLRTRRRVPLLTGALAGAAAAVLAVTALLPSSGHQASQPVHARLAAWTVTTRADGDIQVTVRETSDAAGLERRLRAEGLPVAVRFNPPKFHLGGDEPVIPGCRSIFKSPASIEESLADTLQVDKVVKFYPGLDDSGDWRLNEGDAVLLIHPSKLPDGDGLAFVFFGKDELNFVPVVADLVHKSPECTGS
jgi:hypothetical protein